MEGAARVFAGDFNGSTLCQGTPGTDAPLSVVTPCGVWCNRVFLAGVLTEVSRAGTRLRCRLADPTGAFDCDVDLEGNPGCGDLFRSIAVPSFFSVVGRAQLAGGRDNPAPLIRVESVRIIDRGVRDAWIARTADSTLHSIEVLADALVGKTAGGKALTVMRQYRTTPADLLGFLAMVGSAVAGLSQAPPAPAPDQPAPDQREIVIGIIRELQGARGVAADDVIAQAGIRGIAHNPAKGIIDDLIREDECYQPQKGFVRLL